jgi:hypothetical protein
MQKERNVLVLSLIILIVIIIYMYFTNAVTSSKVELETLLRKCLSWGRQSKGK